MAKKIGSIKEISNSIKKNKAITFISVIAITGFVALLFTHAATFSVSIEPESSTIVAPAIKVTTDTTASSGQYVKFGAGSIACGQSGGTCTSAQVATHNAQSNCWISYNGSYYNVTSYVTIHPGGTSVFNSTTCGHDITSYLNGSNTSGTRHSHSSSAYSTLNSYKIGPVQG